MAKISNLKTDAAAEAPELSLAARIKADADRIEYETDAIGRKIGVKKLNFLDTHHITCLLGPNASNEVALQQAMMASSVVKIDGEDVSRPRKISELEFLMTRLDFHGISAAIAAMSRFSSIGPANQAEEIKN